MTHPSVTQVTCSNVTISSFDSIFTWHHGWPQSTIDILFATADNSNNKNKMAPSFSATGDSNKSKDEKHCSVSRRCTTVPSFKVMDVLRRAGEIQAEIEKKRRDNQNRNKDVSVLHCEIGQPGTGAPGPVAKAAIDALQSNLSSPGTSVMGYTDSFGLLALRQKIATHYAKKYGAPAPDPSRIVVTTGSSGAFLLSFLACFDAGDTVAIASSGYPCYRNILAALGCEQAYIPIQSSSFKLTATELRAYLQQNPSRTIKGLILSSPSNPTGAMLSPSELKELCVLCEEEKIQFISDEIYHGISYGQEEATALQYSPKAMVINSFSKYYSSKCEIKCRA